MPLDTFASQLAYRAKLMERAVHDAGPWSIRCEAGKLMIDIPAERKFLDTAVEFWAEFPPLVEGMAKFHLCWRGEPVATRPMKCHADPFSVTWCLQGVMSDCQRSA